LFEGRGLKLFGGSGMLSEWVRYLLGGIVLSRKEDCSFLKGEI